mmetsp:Transcript_2789/g.5882  ORF Transcript_2789/g.5882 Transcript_2789/m.5882 type:complete len:320 (-) Transcript_2789:215-1174(-)
MPRISREPQHMYSMLHDACELYAKCLCSWHIHVRMLCCTISLPVQRPILLIRARQCNQSIDRQCKLSQKQMSIWHAGKIARDCITIPLWIRGLPQPISLYRHRNQAEIRPRSDHLCDIADALAHHAPRISRRCAHVALTHAAQRRTHARARVGLKVTGGRASIREHHSAALDPLLIPSCPPLVKLWVAARGLRCFLSRALLDLRKERHHERWLVECCPLRGALRRKHCGVSLCGSGAGAVSALVMTAVLLLLCRGLRRRLDGPSRPLTLLGTLLGTTGILPTSREETAEPALLAWRAQLRRFASPPRGYKALLRRYSMT